MEQPTNNITIHNPYSLPLGAACYTILIKALNPGFEQAYAIDPAQASYHPDELEGAATVAFFWAQKDGLQASMMAFCSFAYLDQELNEWVEIDFAE